MIGLAIVSAMLVAIQTGDSPPSKRERNPTAAAAVNDGEVNAQYNALKAKTPSTPAGQWKLGIWCEEHGLKDMAYVHFAEVARLDPKREAVWRKLGFKKVGGRWTTDEQIAEEREQKKADKEWAPRLKKIHKDVHGSNGAKKRDVAQAALAAISDPRAIMPLYREFGGGPDGPGHSGSSFGADRQGALVKDARHAGGLRQDARSAPRAPRRSGAGVPKISSTCWSAS